MKTSTTLLIFAYAFCLTSQVYAVTIAGPAVATSGATYTFTVAHSMAETPIIYTWQATDQTDVIHTDGEISDSVSFTWNTPGIKELTVTADNAEGTFSCIHNVDVRELQISDIRQIDDRIELTLSGTSSYSKYEILYRNGTDEWQIVSLPIRGEDGLTIWEDYQRTDSEIDSYKAVTTDDIAIASFNIMRFNTSL